ncbi:MAG: hypothetical protein J7556_15045 [Acidovorax sp.]|nr:hypothetical protein [Acidovorax sp.]
MNTQEQEQALAQERTAFEQSFAETAGIPQPAAPTAPSTEGTAGAGEAVVPGASTEAAAHEAGDGTTGALTETEAKAGQDAKQSADGQEDDPVILDGLKRSELHRLLSSAADVPNLRKQLDKAHGNIGDLNRKLQQQAQAPAAAPAVPAAVELPPELKKFEEDYPEVAQYVRALGVTPQQKQQEAPLADQQVPASAGTAAAASAADPAGHDPVALELAVMDRMHKGWREKVQSQDFNLWLASQGDEAQKAFDSAQTADDLVSVIGQFDQWATARTVAADKSAKGQQRLARATTPSGNAPRPQSAPTEAEAFAAAFKATMGQR